MSNSWIFHKFYYREFKGRLFTRNLSGKPHVFNKGKNKFIIYPAATVKEEMKQLTVVACDAADLEAAHGFPHANNLTPVSHTMMKNDSKI